MTIRPATRADLIWLRMLYAQLLDEVRPVYPIYDAESLEAFTVGMASRLGIDPGLICYVAEEGPAIVGFGVGEILFRRVGKPACYLCVHWLYAIPTYRGHGIARALCAAGLEDARSKGIQSVELAAVPGDPQWANRGWLPIAVTYMLPVGNVELTLTPHAEPEKANGATAD